MHLIITSLPRAANNENSTRTQGALHGGDVFKKVMIENKDSQLLDKVSQVLNSLKQDCNLAHSADVVHYQMLYRRWKNCAVLSPRTIILTPEFILLFNECLYSENVILELVDKVRVSDVVHIKQEENPLFVTLIFNGLSLFGIKRNKKWRLVLKSISLALKLIDECRNICSSYGKSI
jgi:hypothetical protein